MTLNPVSVPWPNPVGNRCHLLCLITSAEGDRYHNFGQICLVKPRPSGTLLSRGLLLAPSRHREGNLASLPESQPDETPGRDGSNVSVVMVRGRRF